MHDMKSKKDTFRERAKRLSGSSIILQRKNLFFSFLKGLLRIPKKLDTIILILRDIEYQLSLQNSRDFYSYNPLLNSESSRNSQNGEDGIIDFILETFTSKKITFEKNFVEIGVGNGDENNTTQLLLRNFRGIWIDANEQNCEYIKNKYKEFQRLLCINTLVEKNNLEELKIDIGNFLEDKSLTLLSVDIDSVDGLVAKYFSKIFKPLIIVVEINSAYGKSLYDFAKQPSYDDYDYGQSTTAYGATLERFKEIFSSNYTYIYTERTGTNSFFIRNDKYALINENLGNPIDMFASSQRFHLGNYDPKSGHIYTPPRKNQL